MNLFSKEVLEYIFQPCDQEEKPPPQENPSDQIPKILNEESLISKKSYGANSLDKLRKINDGQ
jgi:hypothetical protein